MIIAISCFSKCSIVDVWQGSEYASGSEYSGIWIAHDSEHASFSECTRILDIQRFWICLRFCICQDSEYNRNLNTRATQGSEYTWIIPKYTWISLIMSGYVWICLNLPEYGWICLNIESLHVRQSKSNKVTWYFHDIHLRATVRFTVI